MSRSKSECYSFSFFFRLQDNANVRTLYLRHTKRSLPVVKRSYSRHRKGQIHKLRYIPWWYVIHNSSSVSR